MKEDSDRTGVLLMGFGAVDSLADLEAYYTNIRGGRSPTEEQLENLRLRYERIGGRSPLLDIMRRQAKALENARNASGRSVPVRIGMKFWKPFIGDAVQSLADEGVRRVIALTMGPYDSQISVGGYEKFLKKAQANHPSLRIDLVRHWYEHARLDEAWKEQIHQAFYKQGWSAHDVHVLLSAHALPERILSWNDPYPFQFLEHGRRLAQRLNLPHWGFCYQSAGALATERWLGPDVLDALDSLKDQGAQRVLVAPIGFTADHLEILHDLDFEAKQRADTLGLGFARTASLNDSLGFVRVLQEVVEQRMASPPSQNISVSAAP